MRHLSLSGEWQHQNIVVLGFTKIARPVKRTPVTAQTPAPMAGPARRNAAVAGGPPDRRHAGRGGGQGVAGLGVKAICTPRQVSSDRYFYEQFRDCDEALMALSDHLTAAVTEAFVDASPPANPIRTPGCGPVSLRH